MDELVEESPALPSKTRMKKFAAGIRHLEDAVLHSELKFEGVDGVTQLYELKAYDDLHKLAYSTTFVHGSLSQKGIDLDAINARPLEQLDNVPIDEVRRYVHALYRCERHNFGWGSFVLTSISSGALGMVASRLEAYCSPEVR
ncbi:MAG: hypothetical protein ACRER3_24275 [Pseudomonas fluorescens]